MCVAADLARIKNTALLAIGREAEPAANFGAVLFFTREVVVAVEMFVADDGHDSVTVQIDGRTLVGHLEAMKAANGIIVIFRCWHTMRIWLLTPEESRTMRVYPESPISQP